MIYTYAYKTPDGVRHEATIEAPSRDDAFLSLRSSGIRPIKVVAQDGSKANGETLFITRKRFIFAALGFGVLSGTWLSFSWPMLQDIISPPSPRYHSDMVDKMKALSDAVGEIIEEHDVFLNSESFIFLTNYKIDPQQATHAVDAGKNILNSSRQKIRKLFRPLYGLIPSEYENERTDALKLYADTMDHIDATEMRLNRSEKTYYLLFENRDKWMMKDGKIVFLDDLLEREYSYLQRNPSNAESRWCKDFEK